MNRLSARLGGAVIGGMLLARSAVMGSDTDGERAVTFSTPMATVAGTFQLPLATGKVCCVVLIGGTLSQTRDGAMTNANRPPRNALKRLAVSLAARGFASLRYDRVGYGASRPQAGWSGTYREESQVAAAAIRFAREQAEVLRVVAAGESAGAYLACLAARDGTQADGYIFLGGLCSPAIEMYEYNFGRLAQYAASSPERLAWAKKFARRDLAVGRHYQEMFEAARAGHAEFEVIDDGVRFTFGLARRREELQFPPDEMFRQIRAPVLALGGAKDLNVPSTHPARIASILKEAGNTNAVSFLIPKADHSFQLAPGDADLAWRERYAFASFRRPYATELDERIVSWLRTFNRSTNAVGARGFSPL